MDTLIGHVDRAFLTAVAGPAPTAKKARQTEIINATAALLPALLLRFEINTVLRISHFVAQIAHESDSFCTTREYASGAAYEGRADLGNTQPGDGRRFPGRGEIQNTGRANARNFTLWIRGLVPDAPDFEKEPERMEEFPWAVWVSIWFWATRRLNVLADRDDLIAVTKVVNGGRNGLDQRAAKLAKAKAWLSSVAALPVSAAQNAFPALYRGVTDSVDQIECLQRLLAQAGYYHLSIDGDFGAGTEAALRAYQMRAGLKVDGIAGNMTFSALLKLLNLTRGVQPWTLA